MNQESRKDSQQVVRREIIFPEYSDKNNRFGNYLNSYSNKLKEQEKEIQSRKSALKDR